MAIPSRWACHRELLVAAIVNEQKSTTYKTLVFSLQNFLFKCIGIVLLNLSNVYEPKVKMEFVFLSILAGFIIWFVFGLLSKFSFYSKIEICMKSRGVNPRMIEDFFGFSSYNKIRASCQTRGWSPEQSASQIISLFIQQTEAGFSENDRKLFDSLGI